MRSQDVHNFVEQRATSLVLQSGLGSGFGKRLARESGTQDIVLRNCVLRVTDIAANKAGVGIV